MKRVVGIILAVMMAAAMLPLVVWAGEAEFSDMAGNEYYAKAAKALNEKGILTGYGDGSFKAGNLITRAEMAAVICRAIGAKESAPKAGEGIFNDVSPEHWALGYINAAAQRGIIGGDENGNFHPDDNVKYEEAVKMTVCAAGYGAEIAPDASDWAKPYLEAAEKHGITLGLSAGRGMAVTRGDAAVMLYGAIDPEKANEGRVIMTVSPLSSNVIEHHNSSTISFTLTYTGDVESITLAEDDIITDGLSADGGIIIESQDNARIVTLTAINTTVSNLEDEIRVYIKDGTARSSFGTLANGGCTERLSISGKTIESRRAEDGLPMSGQCGDNVFWSLGNDGVLTISGTGSMWDRAYVYEDGWIFDGCFINDEFYELGLDKCDGYNTDNNHFSDPDDETMEKINEMEDKYPFVIGEDGLVKVIVKNGVTRAGENYFFQMGAVDCYPYLAEVIIEDGMEEIGDDFLGSISSHTKIYIPKSVNKIGDNDWDYWGNVTIIGYKDSYAEQYAKEKNVEFLSIDEATGGLSVKKTEAEIYINGQRISNDVKHPFIDINGVTYFPVTEQNCRLAGYEIKKSTGTWSRDAWYWYEIFFDNWRDEIITLIPTEEKAEYEPEGGECGALLAEPALYTTVNVKKPDDEWSKSFSGMKISCNGVIYVPLNETKEDENPRPWKVTYGEGKVSIETNAN